MTTVLRNETLKESGDSSINSFGEEFFSSKVHTNNNIIPQIIIGNGIIVTCLLAKKKLYETIFIVNYSSIFNGKYSQHAAYTSSYF